MAPHHEEAVETWEKAKKVNGSTRLSLRRADG
jgi:hypothetical protein